VSTAVLDHDVPDTLDSTPADTSTGERRSATGRRDPARGVRTVTPSNALFVVRIGLVVAMMLVVALAAGDIFDERVWWMLISPVMVGLTAVVAIGRRWPTRLTAGFLSVVGSAPAVVLAHGGDIGDVVTSFVAGPQRLLTTDWPSPDLPDLVGTVVIALGVATAVASLLARSTRFHLAPLTPIAIAHGSVIALSAPLGARPAWLIPLAILAIGFAALRPDGDTGLAERITLLRGERRLLPVGLLAIGIAAGLASPLVLTDRADPRRNDPPATIAALLDPIEASLALRAIDPPVDLHEITIISSETARPLRWRTAALEDYDGTRWSPDLTLRPIGRRLAADTDETMSMTVSFLDPNLQLVPLPGEVSIVSAPIETDAQRNIVRLTDRPDDGRVIELTSTVMPAPSALEGTLPSTREIDDIAAGLTEVAEDLALAGGSDSSSDILTRIRAIESTMRDDFVLRSDATGGGLQRALVERFLRDTQRGNSEQFATSFVLLVRSLGVDARVVTGFEIDPGGLARADGATTATLRSDDAAVWAEVRVAGTWVALDPIPEIEASDSAPPPPEPQQQTPSAAQPPIAPPPDTGNDQSVTGLDDDDANNGGFPTVMRFAFQFVAITSVMLIPFVVAVVALLGVKARLRRRHLTGDAVDRIRGAWWVATSRLVDAGLTIDTSDTNADIVDEAAVLLDRGHRELDRLANLATMTTFGSPRGIELLADDAAFCLQAVETSMTETRSRVERARWELSPRSLVRRTATPV